MNTQTRLTRSAHDKVIGGVCSGLAHYFNIDPVIVRLLFVALVFAGGMSIILYPVMWLIMPAANGTQSAVSDGWQEIQHLGQQVRGQVTSAFATGSAEPRYDPQTGQPLVAANRNRTLGAVLLGIGVVLLASVFPGGSSVALALVLLGGGFYLLRRPA